MIQSLCGYQFSRALLELHPAVALDLLAVLELVERGDRRLHEVLRARGAVGLGEDVGDARQFEARADALACGDAGARARRDEHDGARAAGSLDGMGDRRALEVNLHHAPPRVLRGLFDGAGNLVGLAVADADVALSVAGDDERAEAEGPAALDDLGAAVDAYDGGFDAALVGAAAVVASASATATAAALPAASAPASAPAAPAGLARGSSPAGAAAHRGGGGCCGLRLRRATLGRLRRRVGRRR